ncbi:hypothetical protein [Paenibacillus sp.]|nr:hypothetical protein [Paenibacillus sp.]
MGDSSGTTVCRRADTRAKRREEMKDIPKLGLRGKTYIMMGDVGKKAL